MNKSPSIFQEIERKLAKDHYAASLPAYHPAKGKRTLKEPKAVYRRQVNLKSKTMGEAPSAARGSNGNPPDPFPSSPPEIERPGETELPKPGEQEIDPGRDFPPPNLPHPDEEEIPGEKPQPELDPNRIGRSD
jgi:hypothetical protein